MPQTDDEGDKREGQDRAPIVLKVEYKRVNTFFSDYTKNISKGGLFIKTKTPLPVGTLFLFKLFVPGLDAPLQLRGEVRWVRKASRAIKAPEAGMGLRLLYDNDDQLRAVERVVEKLMVEKLGGLIYGHLRNTGLSPED